ncbi:MAG: type II secretion system protein [Candidatus Omnitrophica bacterium]|nr:type II secretion system protein [Candidatus Omnitrophota bacterium]MDD5080859.1 type II secretion system protein [Candidatus Omnitrophota bacterium]
MKKQIKRKNSFTLLETLMVVSLFLVFILIIFQFITVTQKTRAIQESKVTVQIQAQHAMHSIVSRLKLSGAGWVGCSVDVSDGIEFCYPIFSDNDVFYEKTDKIDTYRTKFYHDAVNNRLMMAQKNIDGTIEVSSIANNVTGLTFSCEAGDCSTVRVGVTTNEQNEYTIATKVELRNTNIEADVFNFPAADEEETGEEGEEGGSEDIEG